MKIGASRLTALASAASAWATGRKHDRAMIPARRSAWRSPVCSAIAPPCEKPASTMREAATPRAFSRAMSRSSAACDSRMPRSSGMRATSPWVMSYHARITKPLLMVTGRIGACGKTNRRARPSGSGSSRTIGTKSQPSAPRPCSQMTLPAGSLPVASSIDCSGSIRSAPRGTDRGLRTERLHHVLAGLDVRAAYEIDAVRHGGEDAGDDRLAVRRLQALERLADRFRLSRKVEDQRVAADHRDLAREDRRRHELQADAAHLLAESRHLAIGHGERRLGRHVARGGSGASGRDDEMASAMVLERGNALVAIHALRSAIARRDEPDAHGVVGGRVHGCRRAWSWISAFSQW